MPQPKSFVNSTNKLNKRFCATSVSALPPMKTPADLVSHSPAILQSLWRYRVRNYRMICNIEDDKLLVLVLRVGHRKDVYE